MKHMVMYWALAGVIVPLAILGIAHLQGGVFEWPYLAIALWPSSILTMAIQKEGLSLFNILVPTVSIALNVIWYSVLGAIFWLLVGRFFR